MYDDPSSDPNERERAPFEHQFGPPQYQQPVNQPPVTYQGGAPGYQPQAVQSAPQPQPYQGNGHGNSYQQSPQKRLSNPMAKRLQVLQMATQTGAFELAQVWADQLAMFRNECQARTGYVLGDREALDIITSLLYQAAD